MVKHHKKILIAWIVIVLVSIPAISKVNEVLEIITALAIIMGSAISMMMISSTMMLKEMGFAIAFAIMLDAMVVRT